MAVPEDVLTYWRRGQVLRGKNDPALQTLVDCVRQCHQPDQSAQVGVVALLGAPGAGKTQAAFALPWDVYLLRGARQDQFRVTALGVERVNTVGQLSACLRSDLEMCDQHPWLWLDTRVSRTAGFLLGCLRNAPTPSCSLRELRDAAQNQPLFFVDSSRGYQGLSYDEVKVLCGTLRACGIASVWTDNAILPRRETFSGSRCGEPRFLGFVCTAFSPFDPSLLTDQAISDDAQRYLEHARPRAALEALASAEIHKWDFTHEAALNVLARADLLKGHEEAKDQDEVSWFRERLGRRQLFKALNWNERVNAGPAQKLFSHAGGPRTEHGELDLRVVCDPADLLTGAMALAVLHKAARPCALLPRRDDLITALLFAGRRSLAGASFGQYLGNLLPGQPFVAVHDLLANPPWVPFFAPANTNEASFPPLPVAAVSPQVGQYKLFEIPVFAAELDVHDERISTTQSLKARLLTQTKPIQIVFCASLKAPQLRRHPKLAGMNAAQLMPNGTLRSLFSKPVPPHDCAHLTVFVALS